MKFWIIYRNFCDSPIGKYFISLILISSVLKTKFLWIIYVNFCWTVYNFCLSVYNINELRHDKTNKVTVRPVMTQISLGIRPVWSESLLSAWKNIGSLATHWAHSEDSDQTGQMPRLIWVFIGRTLVLLVLSCCSSYFVQLNSTSGCTLIIMHFNFYFISLFLLI